MSRFPLFVSFVIRLSINKFWNSESEYDGYNLRNPELRHNRNTKIGYPSFTNSRYVFSQIPDSRSNFLKNSRFSFHSKLESLFVTFKTFGGTQTRGIGVGDRGLQPPNVRKICKISHNQAEIRLNSGNMFVNNGFFSGGPPSQFYLPLRSCQEACSVLLTRIIILFNFMWVYFTIPWQFFRSSLWGIFK